MFHLAHAHNAERSVSSHACAQRFEPMRFKSLSGSLLIILYYNRTRNRSVNITVIPKKKNKQTKKNQGVWNTDANHYLDVFRLMSTLQVTCVNDRITCLQHVTHRLEISFGYAKHYLDVFRLMSNLQLTCVNDRITCLQPMASVAERVSHTPAYVVKFQACKNLRTTTKYND